MGDYTRNSANTIAVCQFINFFYNTIKEMSLAESIFNGKSFGKLITRTRSINSDRSKISKRTAFAIGFIRIVPFCAFSTLGNPCIPWQDKWTDTLVIDDKNYTNSGI